MTTSLLVMIPYMMWPDYCSHTTPLCEVSFIQRGCEVPRRMWNGVGYMQTMCHFIKGAVDLSVLREGMDQLHGTKVLMYVTGDFGVLV